MTYYVSLCITKAMKNNKENNKYKAYIFSTH